MKHEPFWTFGFSELKLNSTELKLQLFPKFYNVFSGPQVTAKAQERKVALWLTLALQYSSS